MMWVTYQRTEIPIPFIASAGGWGIGLDEVGVNVIQSDFSDCFFKGYIKAPLIGGKWKYTASLDMIDHDHSGKNDDLRIQFKTEPEENPSFDFFIAELELDKDYTNFALTSCQDETDVELNMTGKITIAGLEDVTKNLPMDMNISGVGFYGMRLANYAPDKEKAKNTGAASLKFAHTFDPICEGEKKGDLWFDLLAFVLLLGAAQGKVDVDRPFTDYLSDHVLAKENCQITVRDLAMHVSGFSGDTRYQRQKDYGEFRRQALALRPSAPRGSYEYQCINMIYVGWIVCAVVYWIAYVRERHAEKAPDAEY